MNISWEVKVAGAYGLQPYHLHVLIVLKSGSLNLLKPSGPVQAWDCSMNSVQYDMKQCFVNAEILEEAKKLRRYESNWL
jgi:hypothetical protein